MLHRPSVVISCLISLIWTCTKYVVQVFGHVSLCRSISPSCSPQQNKRPPHGENERFLSYISNHFVLSNLLSKLHLSRTHASTFLLTYNMLLCTTGGSKFPWQPKERTDISSTGWTFLFCIWANLTAAASVFLLIFFFFSTGGKCHSYQWRTGGWNNNERVVWCQRSDGVNVTGE